MAIHVLSDKNKDAKRDLNSLDRCDSCGAQAYVLVRGVTGELMFCSHHFNKITSTPSGKAAIESFAFETIDQRDKLS
jgi:hypothetical protein